MNINQVSKVLNFTDGNYQVEIISINLEQEVSFKKMSLLK